MYLLLRYLSTAGSFDKDKTSKNVYSHAPLFNRFYIDENVKKGPYHAVSKVDCPDDVVGRCAIRFFYYISSSEHDPNDPPHKSIYTTNEYTHQKLYEEEVSTSHFVGAGGEEY